MVDTRERVADYACNFVLPFQDIWGIKAVLDADEELVARGSQKMGGMSRMMVVADKPSRTMDASVCAYFRASILPRCVMAIKASIRIF